MTPPLDLDDLLRKFRAGTRLKFLFFWSHGPEGGKASQLGPECLSQWYPAPFMIDGIRYPTAEHFMMASKARLFVDTESERLILAAPSPAAAKQLGRRVRGFDEGVWASARFGFVVKGNSAKFAQNSRLGEFIRGTGERVLVEASPSDRVWGIGMAAEDPHACNPLRWRGLNLLGFALMRVREELR